jgi:cyanophycinase
MGTYDPSVIIFQGGGPFEAHDEIDAGVLARTGATTVAVLPTADAMENPGLLVEAARSWAQRVGGPEIDDVMVLQRAEATDAAAARLRAAGAVWVVGDSPMHLRSVLKDTPIVEALRHHADEGVLVAVGACAAAMCDPMTDPRGGAFTLGLGLVAGLALVTESETLTAERLNRTRELAAEHGDACLAVMPSGSALSRDDTGWTVHGDVDVVGDLP